MACTLTTDRTEWFSVAAPQSPFPISGVCHIGWRQSALEWPTWRVFILVRLGINGWLHHWKLLGRKMPIWLMKWDHTAHSDWLGYICCTLGCIRHQLVRHWMKISISHTAEISRKSAAQIVVSKPPHCAECTVWNSDIDSSHQGSAGNNWASNDMHYQSNVYVLVRLN